MHVHKWAGVSTLVIAVLLMLAVDTVASAQDAHTPADLFARFSAGSQQRVDHSVWDRLLKTYVKPQPDGLNRVDYAG